MNCIKSGHKFSTKSCLAIELAWNVLIITLTHIWTQPRGYESICDVPGENKYTDYQDFPVISRDYYWELLFVKQGFHYNASQANQLLYKGILVHLVHNGKSSFASCLLEINQLLWGSGWNNVFSIDRLFKLILVRCCKPPVGPGQNSQLAENFSDIAYEIWVNWGIVIRVVLLSHT